MRAASALLAVLLLAACAGGAPERTRHRDFDITLPAAPQSSAAPQRRDATLRVARVQAPAWLDTRELYYELAYVDPPTIAPYAYSRWVGPAPRLLGRLLRQRLAAYGTWRGVLAADADAPADAELEVRLLAMRQVFTSQTESYAMIRVRATLTDGQGGDVIAQKELEGRAAAPSADARGGVQAFGRAAGQLAADLNRWLTSATQGRFGASG